MLEIALPDYETELEQVAAIGTAGYCLGLGLRYGMPDYFLNRYPQSWTQEYEENNYIFGDPMVAWTFARKGSTRWSECSFPDPRNILKAAAKHGMVYGATFSTKVLSKRAFLSIARSDREATDSEMALLMSKLEIWASLFSGLKISLTNLETQALAAMHSGLKQSEAAESLGISVSALKLRLDGAQKKLGVKNTTSAVGRAVRMNLI